MKAWKADSSKHDPIVLNPSSRYGLEKWTMQYHILNRCTLLAGGTSRQERNEDAKVLFEISALKGNVSSFSKKNDKHMHIAI
jgi:predicted DNA-binding protein with PD1-like motif